MSRRRTWVWMAAMWIAFEAIFSLVGLITADWVEMASTLYGAAAGLTLHWLWGRGATP